MAITTKTGKQLLAELQPDQHLVLSDPDDPGRIITQMLRVGDIYHITGPGFHWFFGNELDLAEYLKVARDADDTDANALQMLNDALTHFRAPAEAKVHTCYTLPAALAITTNLFGWQQ